ncbi:unnamed protein product [Victoria cruziana]
MAGGAIGSLLNKLNTLISDEVRLLSGVQEEVEEIKEELESMRSFLRDAEMRKEREEGVKTWVSQVRSATYQVEDIIDDFILRVARQHQGVNFLHRLHRFFQGLPTRHDVAMRIRTMKMKIYRISQRKDMYAFRRIEERESAFGLLPSAMVTSNEMDVVGMEGPRGSLMECLLHEDEGLNLITLHGRPGLGKSALTSLVFDSQQVQQHFERRTWATASQFSRVEELLKTLLKGLFDAGREMVLKQIEKMDVQALKSMLKKYLSRKRYLIVLQDMSCVKLWEQIEDHLPNDRRGSRIVVTTRSSDVVDSLAHGSAGMTCHLLEIQPLDDDSSMRLFCRKAFPSQPRTVLDMGRRTRSWSQSALWWWSSWLRWRNGWGDEHRTLPPPPTTPEQEGRVPRQLEQVCKRMVKRCEGWPLAIIALGKAMSKKERTREAWERVEQTMSANPSLDNLKSIFSLMYIELPLHLRYCFMYCSLFPEDYLFKRSKLISMWVAEGFVEQRRGMTLEEMAEVYLNELIRRGVLEVVEANKRERVKTFRINALLQSVVLSTSEEEDFGTRLNEHNTEDHEKFRRLTIPKADEAAISSCLRMHRLRSLLFFNMGSIKATSLRKMFDRFRCLRVLDLQDSPIAKLPASLVNLFHLRYLNIRRTKVKRLPGSIHRLANLQTLDVRETDIRTMPRGLSKLENLRRLFMCPYVQFYPLSIDQLVGIEVIGPLDNLKNVQCLTGVNANDRIVQQVGSLIQLKKLEIFRVRKKHGRTLCRSLQNLKRLTRLGIVSISADEPLQLEMDEEFQAPPHIRSLQMAGRLEGLPLWISQLTSLAHLGLFASQLREQPFSEFSTERPFPNLTSLTLHEAYMGQYLMFEANMFPNLKELRLVKLANLVFLDIEEGSMPCLGRLEIDQCCSLEAMPPVLERRLPRLKELELWDVQTDLIASILHEIDEGSLGLNPELNITHQYRIGEEWCTETLL